MVAVKTCLRCLCGRATHGLKLVGGGGSMGRGWLCGCARLAINSMKHRILLFFIIGPAVCARAAPRNETACRSLPVSTGSAVVLAPLSVVCASRGPHHAAAVAAMQAGIGRDRWAWEDSSGAESCSSVHQRVQQLLDERSEAEVVIVPDLEPPYQTTYYRRLRSAPTSSHVQTLPVEPLVQAAAWIMAPYDRMYMTAVALCRQFGWGHVLIMSSDDYHLQTAQKVRKGLTAAGIHILRHQVFSTDEAHTSRMIAHDLDAIQTSGVRVVFLLGSCSATYAILTSARRRGMLKGYAWIVVQPSGHCTLPAAELPNDLEMLETYQGVLGLAWSGTMPRPMEQLEDIDGGADALQMSCHASGIGWSDSNATSADPLDFSPRFLYDALRLYIEKAPALFSSALTVGHGELVDQEPTARPLPAGLRPAATDLAQHALTTGSPTAMGMQRSGGSRAVGRAVSVQLQVSSDVADVAVISFLGARRVDAQDGSSRVEVLYTRVARLSEDMEDGPGLEILTSRPIAWPGDVHHPPIDMVNDDEKDLYGWARRGEDGRSHGGSRARASAEAVLLILTAICIALTPMWIQLYKILRPTPPPPCIEPCFTKHDAVVLLDDKDAKAAAEALIQERLSELTDRQMDLLRSVEVQMSEVVSKGIVGSGSFSVVFKGYYHNSHVAIKVLKKVDEKNLERFLDEIMLHKDLRHPNVVMFRGASWAEGRLIMLCDYAGRGTLADVLRKSRGSLKWNPVKLNMALGIARGVAFLHGARYYDMWTGSYQHCIVHRDLKPQNILVTDSYHILITDFGEARTINRDETMTQVGTQLYCAGEVVRGERYTEKCDVYSFAVVLLSMLELKPDVLDVFAEGLADPEKDEAGITEERMKEPQGVETTDACNTCPLNKGAIANLKETVVQALHLVPTLVNGQIKPSAVPSCPMAKHKAFKGVVANTVMRAVVYDELRPRLPNTVVPALKSLVELCWDPEPSRRPSFPEIVTALENNVRNEVIAYSTRAAEAKRKEQEMDLDAHRRRFLFTSSIDTGNRSNGSGRLGQPTKPVVRHRHGMCPE